MRHHIFQFTTIEDFYDEVAIFDTSREIIVQVFFGKNHIFQVELLAKEIKKKFPLANIIGSSAGKQIASQHILEDSVVVSMTQFKKTSSFSSLHLPNNKLSFDEKNTALGKEIAHSIAKHNGDVAIAFGTYRNIQIDEIISQISLKNPDVVLSGGYAGTSSITDEEVFILHDTKIYTEGFSVIILSNKNLQVSTHKSLSWKSMGSPMTITKVKNNRIYEIDKKKALDVYKTYLGDHIEEDPQHFGMLFPIILNQDSDELLRITTHFHEDGSISYPTSFKKGDIIKFSIAQEDLYLENKKKIISWLKKENPEAVFNYSCVGIDQFISSNLLEEETYELAKISPMCGFYTWGEFFTLPNKEKKFLNYTSTYLALSEEKSRSKPNLSQDYPGIPTKNNENVELKSLITFINTITSQLDESNKKLQQLANTDILTGIHNRRKIQEELDLEIKRHKREPEHLVSVLLFDIDDFKQINDSFGHDVGDYVLKEITKVVQEELREVDVFGRWGGEEFMVIMSHTSLYGAKVLSQRLKEKIEKFKFSFRRKITISGGIVEIDDTSTPEKIIKKVDLLLYRAKREGKNTIFF